MLILFVATLSGVTACADAPPTIAADALVVSASVPAVDEVDELLSKGKRALVDGKGDEALAAFEAAHDASPSLRTRVWVVRGQLAVGLVDEAFDAIIELEADNDDSPDLSYGIGAVRHAIGKREERRRGGNPGAAFEEALAYLTEATDARPDEYPDAWLMLAESARWMGDGETAVAAIERALEVSKTGPTLSLASKIRIARGAALLGEEGTRAEGQRALEQGVKDAAAAVKAFGTDESQAAWIADANLQQGVGLLFLERKDDAAKAYAAAMEWDPTQVDYAQLMGSFTDEDGTLAPFVEVLGAGAEAFEARWGADIVSDAGLHWWKGYAEHRLGRNDEAIASMRTAVAKFPAYANANWYIGVSYYNKGKEHYPTAVASWTKYAEIDEAGFVAMVRADARNLGILQRALFQQYGGGRPQPGTLDSAQLAELILKTDEANPVYWNDVGLMHRDAGAYVAEAEPKGVKMTADEHFERSWEAYGRAIELDRKSYYLNDGAVILHYYLEREYPLALAMYDEAEALAQKALEAGPSEEERPLIEIALRDAKDNRAKLKAKIEREKKKQGGGVGH